MWTVSHVRLASSVFSTQPISDDQPWWLAIVKCCQHLHLTGWWVANNVGAGAPVRTIGRWHKNVGGCYFYPCSRGLSSCVLYLSTLTLCWLWYLWLVIVLKPADTRATTTLCSFKHTYFAVWFHVEIKEEFGVGVFVISTCFWINSHWISQHSRWCDYSHLAWNYVLTLDNGHWECKGLR